MLLGIRCKVGNNIKMDFTRTELEDADWIYLAEDRDEWLALVEAVNNFWV